MDGKVNTYKARLVAKGYKQIQGVDYDETFSPVAMIKSVRILLAIAAYHDYEIWQMDVKTAFLNGNLLEDVYKTQPEGFRIPNENHKICKLQRSKHILRRFHLIREIVERGDVKICKVPTHDNVADPLTKPLAQQKHDGHTRSMGIRGMPNWL
jgi:hypothetical protein